MIVESAAAAASGGSACGSLDLMWKFASFLFFLPAIAFAQLALKDQLPSWPAERWASAAGHGRPRSRAGSTPSFLKVGLRTQMSATPNPAMQRAASRALVCSACLPSTPRLSGICTRLVVPDLVPRQAAG